MNGKTTIDKGGNLHIGGLFCNGKTISVCVVFALVIALNACANKHPQSSIVSVVDTTVALTPLAERQQERPNISPDSLASFIQHAEEVKANVKGNKPFSQLNYNRVIAYDYECGREDLLYIVEKGHLHPAIKQQTALTQKQVDEFTNYLGARSTYGQPEADCFNPHLGIVFYKDTGIVAYLSICLDCQHLESSIEIPVLSKSRKNYVNPGFSQKGRQKLTALCNGLNFSHCKY